MSKRKDTEIGLTLKILIAFKIVQGRPDLGPTICKGYQQTALVDKERSTHRTVLSNIFHNVNFHFYAILDYLKQTVYCRIHTVDGSVHDLMIQGSHRHGKVLEFDLGPRKLLELEKSAFCPGIL